MLTDRCLKDADFALLIEEDSAQLSKWGLQAHSMFEWLAFITEELGELSQAMSEFRYRNGDPEDIVKEAVQVATLSLKLAVMARDQLVECSECGRKFVKRRKDQRFCSRRCANRWTVRNWRKKQAHENTEGGGDDIG